MKTFRLTLSGLVMALYIVLMYAFQSFAFYQFQIRIATTLYALCAPFPFLTIPLAFSNMLSNILLGGLGPMDALGGFIAGLTTCSIIVWIKRKKFNTAWIAIPLIFGPAFIIPLYLSYLLQVPYTALVISVGAGQVLPGILGVMLVQAVEKFLLKKTSII